MRRILSLVGWAVVIVTAVWTIGTNVSVTWGPLIDQWGRMTFVIGAPTALILLLAAFCAWALLRWEQKGIERRMRRTVIAWDDPVTWLGCVAGVLAAGVTAVTAIYWYSWQATRDTVVAQDTARAQAQLAAPAEGTPVGAATTPIEPDTEDVAEALWENRTVGIVDDSVQIGDLWTAVVGGTTVMWEIQGVAVAREGEDGKIHIDVCDMDPGIGQLGGLGPNSLDVKIRRIAGARHVVHQDNAYGTCDGNGRGRLYVPLTRWEGWLWPREVWAGMAIVEADGTIIWDANVETGRYPGPVYPKTLLGRKPVSGPDMGTVLAALGLNIDPTPSHDADTEQDTATPNTIIVEP